MENDIIISIWRSTAVPELCTERRPKYWDEVNRLFSGRNVNTCLAACILGDIPMLNADVTVWRSTGAMIRVGCDVTCGVLALLSCYTSLLYETSLEQTNRLHKHHPHP